MQTLKPMAYQHAMAKSIKKFMLLVIACSAISDCFSQETLPKNTISVSFGAALPLGNFRASTPLDNTGGYAKPGETLNISFDHNNKRSIGFSAMLYGQSNALNTKAFTSQLPQRLFFYNRASGEWRSYGNWSVDKKNWYVESILAGINGEWPLAKKSRVTLIAKVLVGLCYVQSPALQAQSRSDTAYAVFNQTNASSFGVSFLATGGVKYRLANKIYFLLNTCYFVTNTINFKNVNEFVAATNGGLIVPGVYLLSNSRGPQIVASNTYTTSQPIGNLNITAGLAWAL